MNIQVSQALTTKSLDFSGFYSYLKTLPRDSWQYQLTDYLIFLAQFNKEVFPLQGTMAKRFGVCLRSINTHIADLKNFGVFRIKSRGLYQSARYIFAEDFQDDQVRGTFGTFFKSFCYMSYKKLQQLLPKPIAYSIELIEPYKEKKDLTGDCLSCEFYGELSCCSCQAQNVSFNIPEARAARPGHGSLWRSGEGVVMTFEEKRRVLERMKNGETELSAITPAIENFKSLQLTTAGMVMLTGYTDEVIAYADDCLGKKVSYRKFDNPFGYVVGICRSRSSELGLPVQGRFAHELREFYRIELDAPKHQPIERSSYKSNSYQPIQRGKSQDHQGDKQTGMTHVETMTSDEIKAAIDHELSKNENPTYSCNPNQLVGADGRVELTLLKRLATLEGELPSSLPTTPCENYAKLKAMQPPSSSGFFGESLADLFKRNLANAHKACQNYCGQDLSVAPAAPREPEGPKFDDSEMNLEEVYEVPTYY